MPLPASGPISLLDLQNEFGGGNPIGLNEYYRNGGLVGPSNTNVPTSGAISLSQFYGASGAPSGPTGTVKLTPVTVTNEIFMGGASSIAGLALERSGKLLAFANQYAPSWFEITPVDEWLNPESLADADFFECRAVLTSAPTLVSYTDAAGYVATTAWTRLGTNGSTRYWWTENAATWTQGTVTDQYRIQIRNRITLATLVDAAIVHNAIISSNA